MKYVKTRKEEGDSKMKQIVSFALALFLMLALVPAVSVAGQQAIRVRVDGVYVVFPDQLRKRWVMRLHGKEAHRPPRYTPRKGLLLLPLDIIPLP